MNRGFTLIEMLVSVALFSMVMVVAIGALLGLSVATRKAEGINSTVNNLGSALDSMSRTIRTGINYHCGNTGSANTTQDCASGSNFLEFQAADGTYVAYCWDTTATLYRKTLSSNPNNLFQACDTPAHAATNGFLALTAPEVKIGSFAFYVNGSCPATPQPPNTCTADKQQPVVTMIMAGTINITSTQSSSFNIQTTVTQRLEDL